MKEIIGAVFVGSGGLDHVFGPPWVGETGRRLERAGLAIKCLRERPLLPAQASGTRLSNSLWRARAEMEGASTRIEHQVFSEICFDDA